MNRSAFIGIDLGTSAVKLLLVDLQGTVLNTVSREYPCTSRSPAGPNRTRRTGGRRYGRASGN